MERKLKTSAKISVRQITVIGMLSSISILLGLTGLGFIPIPPVKATIMHVPVIIGSIVEGPFVGAMIGLIFGIFSVIQAITVPTPLSFVFMNPVVSILPRIVIGITAYYSYKLMFGKYEGLKIGFGAAIGSITNTVGVLGFMYLLYVERYAKMFNLSTSVAGKSILGIAIANGVPEMILSVAITIPVAIAMKKLKK